MNNHVSPAFSQPWFPKEPQNLCEVQNDYKLYDENELNPSGIKPEAELNMYDNVFNVSGINFEQKFALPLQAQTKLLNMKIESIRLRVSTAVSTIKQKEAEDAAKPKIDPFNRMPINEKGQGPTPIDPFTRMPI